MLSRPRLRPGLALLAAIGALGLAGCAATAPDAAASSTPAQPTPAQVDTVELTFVVDGEEHTVTAKVGDGLRSCNDAGTTVVADSPSPNAGVMVPKIEDGGEATTVSAWAVGDYAVQFLGEGVVTPSDGGFRGTQISGKASVLPVEPGTTPKIADLEMKNAPYEDATLSFSIACNQGSAPTASPAR